MDIKNGDVINLGHYSNRTNSLARIIEISGAFLKLELLSKRNAKFEAEEPAVIICNSDSGFFVKGCSIISVDENGYLIKICCDNNCTGENKRMYDRYPVSYYTDLKFLSENKRYPALVKDISKYGFKILTEVEIPIDQMIEISPYLDKKLIFITASIIRVVKKNKFHEYGAKISGEDYHSIQETTSILKIAGQNYTEGYINTIDGKRSIVSNFELAFDTTENKVVVNTPKNLDDAVDKLSALIRRTRY